MSYNLLRLAKMAFICVWMALAPIRPALLSILLLPLVDLTLGLIAAYRAKRPITSSGIKRTVAKVLIYQVAALLAFCVETYLTGGWVPAVRMVTGLIGVTELKSCLEHLDELGGSPLFASLLKKLAPGHPEDPTDAS